MQLNLMEYQPTNANREVVTETLPPNEMYLELPSGEILAKHIKPLLRHEDGDKLKNPYIVLCGKGLIVLEKGYNGNFFYSTRSRYPKGIGIKGKYKGIVDAKIFCDVLSDKITRSKRVNTSVYDKENDTYYRSGYTEKMKCHGLAKCYVQIIVNSHIEIKHRNFVVKLPNHAEVNNEIE